MTITGFPDIFTWAVCSIYLLGLSLIAHKTHFTRDSALWTVESVDESTAREPESLTDWRPDFVQPKAYILLSGERKGKGKTEKKENSKERRGKEATINNEFKVHLSNKQLAIQKDTKRMTKNQLLKHSMWTHTTTWPCGHCPSHLFRRYLLAEKGFTIPRWLCSCLAGSGQTGYFLHRFPISCLGFKRL